MRDEPRARACSTRPTSRGAHASQARPLELGTRWRDGQSMGRRASGQILTSTDSRGDSVYQSASAARGIPSQ